MPDIYGRLKLVEMREQVRRKLDLLRFGINQAGEETGQQQLDRLISNEDLNMYLNMALARRCIDVNIADNTIMGDEATIDVLANQVEYALPADFMFLRGVYWKGVGTAFSLLPPNQRYPLLELDSDNDIAFQPSFDNMATYRRRLNAIVLNQVPQTDNPGGLLIDYVKMMLPLLDDDQILETPLSWILQQVIMQDAAVECTSQKLKLDTTDLRMTQGELVEQLKLAVMNYHAPKVITMTPGVVVAYPPFVRRPNSWQRVWGYNSWW